MQYHPVVDKIKNLLKENGALFETFEHEPVRTSAQAANVRPGYTSEQGAKAIIARVKEPNKGKRFAMFVLSGNKRFDIKKIKSNLGLVDIRFATEQEVIEMTGGVLPGGVPPFGNLFGLDVFADQGLFENEKIVFNAGDKSYSIAMRSEDFRRIVNPVVSDIVEGV